MGILASILGGGEVIKAGFDLIDDLHTSDEEAMAAKAKAKTDLLTAYAPFKLAQRLLAAMFATTFLSCFVLVLVMALNGNTDIAVTRQVISEFYVGEIMLTIVIFYFGGGFAEGALKAKNG
jgi:hypothetical protein